MVGMVWDLDIAFEAVTLVLSVGMLINFLSGFRGLRSRFAKGLTLLSCVLSAQAGLSVYLFHYFSGSYGLDVSLPMGVISALEMLGVATLFYLSVQ